MFDFDKWQEILDSLRRHRLRTLLTALSVWWGIFMLVILLGAGNGLQNSFEHNFRDDALNSLWIYRGTTSEPYKGLPVGRRVQFTNADYEMVKQTEGIEHITGRYYLGGEYVVKRKNKTLSYDVRSVHPDHQYLENTLTTEGRFLNTADVRKSRKVCAIGRIVADELFEPGEPIIGEYVNVRSVEYKVVGVFDDNGPESEVRKIYIPITTAQRVYEGTDRVHQLMVTVGEIGLEGSKKIEDELRTKFAARHNFSPSDRQAIRIYNNIEEYEEFQTIFTFIKGFIWFVGIGSIIAGVIGVSNIMLIVVKDRTKEIGIRKAMGATPGSIISMILQEAVFLTATAGYLGLLCGFSLVYGIQQFMVSNEIEVEFFYNPEVNFGTVITALLILVICGALAGLIPAMQAVRINPVQAMKQ
ncbi:MAG: ABC transporter permease [Phaeodactylibacter sp.]|nr:ABC transporter permease [Phaeodactylibacter sp.]